MQTLAVRRLALAFVLLAAMLLAACGGAPSAAQPTTSSSNDSTAAREVAATAPALVGATSAPTQAPLGTQAPMVANEAAAGAAGAPQADSALSEAPVSEPVVAPEVEVNPFTSTTADNLSTFAMDVDTAAYSAARNYLEAGQLPPPEAVRVEEFINYFSYGYPQPEDTFGITIDGAPAPFGQAGAQLVRVGIHGREIDSSQRDPAVLTFVVDISGSMAEPNRLPLVRESLKLLVDQLREGDKVAIVAYGDQAFTVLDPTPATEHQKIIDAINSLDNAGSTNAEDGLRLGYELAGNAFTRGASNRVILCSDGVANVGATGPDAILNTIHDRAAQGIYLTTVGFGMGDYNDYLMEQLANDGNGSYAYVDTLDEAKRIFVENLTGTLQVIAKDAKIQVVFNPAVVSQYRLLGYENRAVADADFRNDKVDAGEVGAGHSVTALYEVVLTNQAEGELLNVQLRWAEPESGEVREISRPFTNKQLGADFAGATPGLRLAGSVAGFAEILRGSAYAGNTSLGDIRAIVAKLAAEQANDADIQELLVLVDKAAALMGD